MSALRQIEAPLFPLDSFVLFPGSTHTFHLFEERHREMMEYAREVDHQIIFAQLRPGWEQSYFGAPEVHRVAGLGRLISENPLPDDRADIGIEGVHRVRIKEETAQFPSRIARAEILLDVEPLSARDEISVEMVKIERLTVRLANRLPPFQRDLTPLTFHPSHAARTVDQIAHRFVRDTYDRQSILDETDIPRRVTLVRVQLQRLVQRFLSEEDFAALMDEIGTGDGP